MKTIEQLEKEMAMLQQDLEALKAQPEQLTGRVFDGDYRGECFTVYTDGEVFLYLVASKKYTNQGRNFYDFESAERFSLFERLQQRERVAAAKAWEDAGKVLDWGDKYQVKYRAAFDHNINKVEHFCYALFQAPQPHFPSEESLLAFYDTLKKDEQRLLCTGVE